jgi:cytosine/adenosine deaminase-related metal-dependent hydrolase
MEQRTPCDVLLTNAHVLRMDPEFTVHTPGCVAIEAGRILDVGGVESRYVALEVIDCRGRVGAAGFRLSKTGPS